MGKREVTTDLTYDELRTLLIERGYEEYHLEPVTRDRLAFIHHDSGHIIRLERQHARETLSHYQVQLLREELDR